MPLIKIEYTLLYFDFIKQMIISDVSFAFGARLQLNYLWFRVLIVFNNIPLL